MAGILHVAEDLHYGGAQTQLRLLAEAELSSGGLVTVASLRRPGVVGESLRRAGARVEWLGRRLPLDPFAVRRLLLLMRGGAFRAVQSWDPAAGRHVLAARRWAGARVRWLHAVRDLTIADPLERRVRRTAERLVVPSTVIADALVADGAVQQRIAVVPNDSDPPTSADRESVLRRFGMPPSARLITAAMRLDEARHAKEMVWAADLVRVVRPEVRLILVGDGDARRRVERFARGASEAGLVVAAGWRDDWAEVLAAADVVWCASRSPGAPTSLLEALRAGKPVVTNEAPGRDRLIVDQQTGWLTPWAHRAGWARPTARALEDRSFATRVGAAGRERVAEAFPSGCSYSTHAGLSRV